MAEDTHIYRQDHDKMQRAAEVSVTGPAATDTVAASGGLDLRNTERPHHGSVAEHREPELIPGETDRSTEAPTEPAIVGTTGFGGDLPRQDVDPTVNDDTLRERRWESGGDPSQRPKATR